MMFLMDNNFEQSLNLLKVRFASQIVRKCSLNGVNLRDLSFRSSDFSRAEPESNIEEISVLRQHSCLDRDDNT